MSLGFGIGFSGIGLGLGVGGGNRYATRDVSRLLLSGDNVNLYLIGDSRTANPFHEILDQYCDLPWAGSQIDSASALSSTSNWTSRKSMSQSMQDRVNIADPYSSRYIDEFDPYIVYTTEVLADIIAPNVNDLTNRFWSSSSFGISYHPTKYARGISDGVTTLDIYYPLRKMPTSTNNIQVQHRPANSVVLSNKVDVDWTGIADEQMNIVHLASNSLDFTVDQKGPELVFKRGAAITTGGLITHWPICRIGQGVTIFPWSIGGSNVLRWKSDVLFGENLAKNIVQDYANVLGGKKVFWIDLGTNGTESISATWQEQYDAHVANMTEIVNRLKFWHPDALFLLTDSFLSGNDTPGIRTPYSVGSEYVAKKTGCGFISTQQAMGSYADMLANGWFNGVDVIHLSLLGRQNHARIIGELIQDAA